MTSSYDSSAIEVLTGLEPVRKRPGMYTTTERPNHLAQEVIDNSADEAIAGYCDEISVTLHDDGSLSVTDNGRGMPVDKHAKEGVSGVEVILTRLHDGAKFSEKNYRFSGGLHGVGVSVVNALSKKLQVWVRRDGKEYFMWFADGKKRAELKAAGEVGKRNTGTTIRFWPDEKFFDTTKFNVPRLKHVMRAKAVLAPGLRLRFIDENDKSQNEEWYYEDGLTAYLTSEVAGCQRGACDGDSVTPSALTPSSLAACMTMPPQPQATSSSRMPSASPSWRATRSNLDACAASSETSSRG